MAQRNVLLLEDDSDWTEIYTDTFKQLGWRFTHVDSIPLAIKMLQDNDQMFDIVLADKGGTNGLYGSSSPDKYGHRDGLWVLRASKELYGNSQIRVLATGERWSRTIFDDPTLGLHAFVEKTGDINGFFRWLNTIESPSEVKETVLFTFQAMRSKESYR